MNNFENEYKKNLEADTPDLWARIEASIDSDNKVTTIQKKKSNKSIIIKSLSMAACLFIVVGIAIHFRPTEQNTKEDYTSLNSSNNVIATTPANDTEYDQSEQNMDMSDDCIYEDNLSMESIQNITKHQYTHNFFIISIEENVGTYIITATNLDTNEETILISYDDTADFLEENCSYNICYIIGEDDTNEIISIGGCDE